MALHALLDYVPLLALLAVAAVIDVRCRRIPNWLTFGLILAGLGRALMPQSPQGLGLALAGLFAGAAIPWVLFVMGALGGGDVKLLAAIGAWVGAAGGVAVFAATCVIGLFIIVTQSLIQGRTVTLFRNSAVLAATISQRGVAGCAGEEFSSVDRPMAYAVPVAVATALVLLERCRT